ncbi:MAG: hypothetical protein Q4B70_08775, partial [Lachnospiraceae bacterium]|nr:hypothetical protein [Lachnospiraceae bacterium]
IEIPETGTTTSKAPEVTTTQTTDTEAPDTTAATTTTAPDTTNPGETDIESPEEASTTEGVEEELPEEEEIYLHMDEEIKIELEKKKSNYEKSYFEVHFKENTNVPNVEYSSFSNNDYMKINPENSNNVCEMELEWFETSNLDTIDYIKVFFVSSDPAKTERILMVYPATDTEEWYLEKGEERETTLAESVRKYNKSYIEIYDQDGNMTKINPSKIENNDYINVKLTGNGQSCNVSIAWDENIDFDTVSYAKVFLISSTTGYPEKIITVYPMTSEVITVNKTIEKEYFSLISWKYDESYFQVYFKNGRSTESIQFDEFDNNEYLSMTVQNQSIWGLRKKFTIKLNKTYDFSNVDYIQMTIRVNLFRKDTFRITIADE